MVEGERIHAVILTVGAGQESSDQGRYFYRPSADHVELRRILRAGLFQEGDDPQPNTDHRVRVRLLGAVKGRYSGEGEWRFTGDQRRYCFLN